MTPEAKERLAVRKAQLMNDPVWRERERARDRARKRKPMTEEQLQRKKEYDRQKKIELAGGAEAIEQRKRERAEKANRKREEANAARAKRVEGRARRKKEMGLKQGISWYRQMSPEQRRDWFRSRGYYAMTEEQRRQFNKEYYAKKLQRGCKIQMIESKRKWEARNKEYLRDYMKIYMQERRKKQAMQNLFKLMSLTKPTPQ